MGSRTVAPAVARYFNARRRGVMAFLDMGLAHSRRYATVYGGIVGLPFDSGHEVRP